MALKTSVDETEDRVFQGSNNSREVVASHWNNGVNIRVYDDMTTTTDDYCGLTEDAAKAFAASKRSNTMTDYRIRSSSTVPFSQIICPQAKGTRVTATARRDGISRMFTVTVTTEVHACSNSAGWGEF